MSEDGQKVLIEFDGDISTSTNQFEVKKSNSKLTESSINLWKTLKNWLQKGFDASKYHGLILLTTQTISKGSLLTKWDDLKTEERLDLLKNIYAKALDNSSKKSKVTKIMEEVLKNEEDLMQILPKIKIASNQKNTQKLIDYIEGNKCLSIPKRYIKNHINSLIGFIWSLSPLENKNDDLQSSWEVTYEKFRSLVQASASQYRTEKIVLKIKEEKEIEISKYQDKKFIFKINEIGYQEKHIEAISDYIYTLDHLFDNTFKYRVPNENIANYKNDLKINIEAQRSIRMRISNTDKIMASQTFYDETMISTLTPLSPEAIEQINLSFRNGLIHLVLEENENIQWRLW